MEGIEAFHCNAVAKERRDVHDDHDPAACSALLGNRSIKHVTLSAKVQEIDEHGILAYVFQLMSYLPCLETVTVDQQLLSKAKVIHEWLAVRQERGLPMCEIINLEQRRMTLSQRLSQ